mgnify:CR=1 FL=1
MTNLPEELHNTIRLRDSKGREIKILEDINGRVKAITEFNTGLATVSEVEIRLEDAKSVAKGIVRNSTRKQLNEGWGDIDRAELICDYLGLNAEEVFS